MKKRSPLPLAMLFSFSVLHYQATYTLFPYWFGGKPKQAPQSSAIRIQDIEKEIVNTIRNLCEPKSIYLQTQAQKNAIDNLIESAKKAVYHHLANNAYKSHTEAAIRARDIAKEIITEHLAGLVAETAQQEIRKLKQNPPVNPRYINKINPEEFSIQLAMEEAHEIKKCYDSNKRGALNPYLTEALTSYIAKKVYANYVNVSR